MSKHLIPELAAIVDTVATHLAHQRRRAVTRSGTGRFRAEDGGMCAIGCLFPDALYDYRLETGVYNLFTWTLDHGASRFGEVRPQAVALVNHFHALAPSVERTALRKFLGACMFFHDATEPYGGVECYQQLLDRSRRCGEAALKAKIAARLIEVLQGSPDTCASWWEARP